MKIKSVLLGIGLSLILMACGPKDSDIEKEIAAKMGDMPGMQVNVKDGIATISGVCKDESCKESCESIAKGVKGVKSVVNNCEIAPPPPPAAAPVVISADSTLSAAVTQVVQAYSGINATVVDGVVTLTGEIKRTQLPALMQSLQELHPKKVENKLTIK